MKYCSDSFPARNHTQLVPHQHCRSILRLECLVSLHSNINVLTILDLYRCDQDRVVESSRYEWKIVIASGRAAIEVDCRVPMSSAGLTDSLPRVGDQWMVLGDVVPAVLSSFLVRLGRDIKNTTD